MKSRNFLFSIVIIFNFFTRDGVFAFTGKYVHVLGDAVLHQRPLRQTPHLSFLKKFKIWILTIFICLLFGLPEIVLAQVFPLPKAGDTMVGTPQTAQVKADDDFSSVAERYDIGYYELFESNPGVDANDPEEGAVLIIPTQYILPEELKEDVVLINLAEMRIYFRPAGKNIVYIFPVGIGKVDWETPTGEAYIVSTVKNPVWNIPESVWKYRAAHGEILPRSVPSGPENPMGYYKLQLSIGGDYIHGTNLPAGVGRRSSAGCIRMYNPDIEKLFNMVKVRTKVLIINKPYKAGWQNGKLYLEAHVPLLEQRIEMPAGDRTPIIEAIDKVNPNQQRVHVDWQKAFRVMDEHVGVPRDITKS